LITFNIGSQVEIFRGFAPTGSPRYLNGIEPLRQFRKFVAIERKSSDTLTPIMQLFEKFTFKPDAISKPRSIAFKDHKFSILASPIQRVSSAY
jgi:hypothetical protein